MQNFQRKKKLFSLWENYVDYLFSFGFEGSLWLHFNYIFFISVRNTTAMGITGIRAGWILVMLIAQGCFMYGDSSKF